MNGKKTTIKSKLEAMASKTPKRLMGFREWCEKVWNPAKKAKTPTSPNTLPETVHELR